MEDIVFEASDLVFVCAELWEILKKGFACVKVLADCMFESRVSKMVQQIIETAFVLNVLSTSCLVHCL